MRRAAVLVIFVFNAVATWQEATKGRRGLFRPPVSEEMVHCGEGMGKVAGSLDFSHPSRTGIRNKGV